MAGKTVDQLSTDTNLLSTHRVIVFTADSITGKVTNLDEVLNDLNVLTLPLDENDDGYISVTNGELGVGTPSGGAAGDTARFTFTEVNTDDDITLDFDENNQAYYVETAENATIRINTNITNGGRTGVIYLKTNHTITFENTTSAPNTSNLSTTRINEILVTFFVANNVLYTTLELTNSNLPHGDLANDAHVFPFMVNNKEAHEMFTLTGGELITTGARGQDATSTPLTANNALQDINNNYCIYGVLNADALTTGDVLTIYNTSPDSYHKISTDGTGLTLTVKNTAGTTATASIANVGTGDIQFKLVRDSSGKLYLKNITGGTTVSVTLTGTYSANQTTISNTIMRALITYPRAVDTGSTDEDKSLAWFTDVRRL